MRRAVVLAGLTALGVILAGCPPTYPNCSNDEHCREHGQVCVQGQCQECATDANCKEGFVCRGNRCVPKPECTPTGNECGPGRRCENGRCVEAPAARTSGCTADGDCPAGQKCEAGQCVEAQASADCSYQPIRFEFNESTLTSDARSTLERLADCIKRQNSRLTLEGHADDRGTEEYNLQLSNRRAESVRRYLVTLGVTGRNLETVGYGETRPAESGSGEDAWSANRRVEFRP
ncbi:MAG TPA: OmpA family protein [Myxococcaceae bacterium]|nr:OmpA family protein [Myxococcaceae bacterium]